MRRDVQEIFRATPHEKQVMMFSATLSKDIRPVCKKFMQDVRIISAKFYFSCQTLKSANDLPLPSVLVALDLLITIISSEPIHPFVTSLPVILHLGVPKPTIT